MPVDEFTIDDLRRVLRAAAGEGEGGLDADILDLPFDDLGYDSVMMLETSSRIQRERGIELPDETVTDADTPRALLDVVNARLAARALA
jgi:act minimal PKS acyl carrier protein